MNTAVSNATCFYAAIWGGTCGIVAGAIVSEAQSTVTDQVAAKPVIVDKSDTAAYPVIAAKDIVGRAPVGRAIVVAAQNVRMGVSTGPVAEVADVRYACTDL